MWIAFVYFNPLALWALPLYRCATQGESVIPDLLLLQSMFFNPSVILTPLSLRTPPLYFALQNTGEVLIPYDV